jgi:hypothetical protein
MKSQNLCWLVIPLVAGTLSYLVSSRGWLPRWFTPDQRGPVLDYRGQLDLGEHEVGEEIIAPFSIANRGGRPLTIDDVRTNCSCTGMERIQDGHYVRIESLTLNAGEEARLFMRVSVRGAPAGGAMVNIVEFHSNDPLQPVGHIEAVVSRVSRGVSISPGSVVFGTVPLGHSVRHLLDVRDTAVPPRSIERVSSTNPARVSVRFLPGSQKPAEAESHADGLLIGQLEITVGTGSPGEVNEAVHVHLAGERRDPDAVAVIGKVAAPIEVIPSMLVLPRTSTTGPLYDATCLCRSTNGDPLVLSVDSVPDGLKVEVLDNGSPQVRMVRVICDPRQGGTPAGGQTRTVRLRAKAGKTETVLALRVLVRT